MKPRIRNQTISRMCKEKVILAVNDQFPGPAIEVTEGDSVVVHVVNESPFDMTIHWHGLFQLRNAWADGPNMVTQCPIRPGRKQTYRFNVTGQEGTLWWHAHASYHRVTVHGPLIIRPKGGTEALPFPKPDDEVTVVLGEWWNANVVDAEKEVMRGITSTISDAFTINGYPGDLYNCSG
uniref:Plastocyanin-like domain-containing protein n=1 Tax=Ananas comosus var. bracteatus TaxID=296719 RepID=A0A6V7PUH7_ANACO|nr:unnamed protein product [Ananas comosus var. bracteatus]